jgi:hypothetical protein
MINLITSSNNPLDGRNPDTGALGGSFNHLIGTLTDSVWGIALIGVIVAWIVAAAYFGVKQRNNPGQAGGAKTWLISASVALILVAAANVIVGGLLNVASS